MKTYFTRYHYSATVLLVGVAVLVGGAALHSLLIAGGGVILLVAANFLQSWSMKIK